MIGITNIKSVHPFPARMAPSIVWDRLPDNKPPLRILDPMAGSGTTLAVARSKGHFAYGVDRDPLAVIIAKAWCGNIDEEKLRFKAEDVLEKAKKTMRLLSSDTAYPQNSDKETNEFIKYWFDLKNRKQLTALSKHIALVHDEAIKIFLWTAFSRMVITKKIGVSLAMDISHSRPHKVYKKAPVTAFDIFLKAVEKVVKANLSSKPNLKYPDAAIIYGDSRRLSFKDNFFDLVITSPPYLNAIDYLRGHKLSLVWMRNSIAEIRELRTTNIGAEVKCGRPDEYHILEAIEASGTTTNLNGRQLGFLTKYIVDMDLVCGEIARVLKPNGNVVYVIGDSMIKNTFICNSKVIKKLSEHHGLQMDSLEERTLSENSRYLPPPSNQSVGKQLQGRMRKEVILVMKKS